MAASDTREDTLISIIIRTLYVKGLIPEEEITKNIQEEFNFEPYEPEIKPLISKLKSEDRIQIDKGKVSLTKDEIESVITLEMTVSDADKERFQNFKNFIIETLEEEIDIKKIKLIWSIFLEYLYDSFYEYGYDALKTLHPYITNDVNNNGTYKYPTEFH